MTISAITLLNGFETLSESELAEFEDVFSGEGVPF